MHLLVLFETRRPARLLSAERVQAVDGTRSGLNLSVAIVHGSAPSLRDLRLPDLLRVSGFLDRTTRFREYANRRERPPVRRSRSCSGSSEDRRRPEFMVIFALQTGTPVGLTMRHAD